MTVLVLWTALWCTEYHIFINASPLPDQIPADTPCKDILPGPCNLCLTKGCITAAYEILRKMELNVNPCDNFYEFACGNFLKETTIPVDKNSVLLNFQIKDKLMDQLRSVMENTPYPGETRCYVFAKTLYNSCMNTSRIEEVGLTHMVTLLRRVGGWPVLEADAWDEAKFTWQDTTYKLNAMGFDVDYMLKLSVRPESNNSSRRVIHLGEAALSDSWVVLANANGTKNARVSALRRYMCDVTLLMGAADRNRTETELTEALQFEIQLAKMNRQPKDHKFGTVHELQERIPSIPWTEYFRRMLPNSVKIEYDEVLNVPWAYLENLADLLQNTSKRSQANYLMWRAVASAVPSLTEGMRELKLKYMAEREGKSKEELHKPRWKVCLSYTTSSLKLAVGSIYVKRFFKEDTKSFVTGMVNSIREQMRKFLEQADWMDETTREKATEKERATIVHIAFPEEILDVNKLGEFYSKLEITDGDYLEMVLNLTKFNRDHELSQLVEPVSRADWRARGEPHDILPFYIDEENAVELPAGVLQGAFFSQDRPNYMNYGSIGMVIGHEITHAFDSMGRRHDKDGKVVDWWEPTTDEMYLKKVACLIQQYGNYTSKQVNQTLNGVNTQNENMADNVGVKLAYHAYSDWVNKHGQEQRLPGLERFTPQQMFWISAASIRCEKQRPEKLKATIARGEHSPGEFRVQGPFSNRPEFAEDFECPLGSNMNPASKCQLW